MQELPLFIVRYIVLIYLVNNPVDVVKTKMQSEMAKNFKGPLDCALNIWKNEGLRGFYKGTAPRLTHVIIDVSITFVLYEKLSKLIDEVWVD